VPAKGAKFLNDIAVGPDGKLYATDTGVAADDKGMSHPGPDRIYEVAGRKASVALESPRLSGPNGITWADDHFVVVPFFGTEIVSWKPGDKDVTVIGTGPGQQDGVEVLADGRLLTNSWVDSSLFVLENGNTRKIATGVPSPADIGYDGKSKVLVPLLMENRVELWELP
jgi:sugar lactone lactonase YvrE